MCRIVGVEDTFEAVPAMLYVHPNPASESIYVAFFLSEPSVVDLAVFTVSGVLVRRLEGSARSAGMHGVVWNGRTEAGRPAASGMYLIRLEARGHTETRKVLFRR